MSPRFLVVAATLLLACSATAQDLRIHASHYVKDTYGHDTIEVMPGEAVFLSAEISGTYSNPTDFVWRTLDNSNDRCDPSASCPKDSRFEVVEGGVIYKVPWNPPPVIPIEARWKWGDAKAKIVLVVAGERPWWEEDLAGLGTFVRIEGTVVFVPTVYVVGWRPYTHGFWYWTAYGWTWFSYDPWGPITDHCGHWRHHKRWGWVWIPDPICVWRPAVVTFFYGPVFIGWYPYDPYWNYEWGYAEGFDDGYWLGYAAGQDGKCGHCEPGLVATTYDDFCPKDPTKPFHPPPKGEDLAQGPLPSKDFQNLRRASPEDTNKAFMEAIKKGALGPIPGGGKRPEDGLTFIANKTGFRPKEVKLVEKPVPKGRFFEPAPGSLKVPEPYVEAANKVRNEGPKGLSQGAPIPPRQDIPKEFEVKPIRQVPPPVKPSPPQTSPDLPRPQRPQEVKRPAPVIVSPPSPGLSRPKAIEGPQEIRAVPPRPLLKPPQKEESQGAVKKVPSKKEDLEEKKETPSLPTSPIRSRTRF